MLAESPVKKYNEVYNAFPASKCKQMSANLDTQKYL